MVCHLLQNGLLKLLTYKSYDNFIIGLMYQSFGQLPPVLVIDCSILVSYKSHNKFIVAPLLHGQVTTKVSFCVTINLISSYHYLSPLLFCLYLLFNQYIYRERDVHFTRIHVNQLKLFTSQIFLKLVCEIWKTCKLNQKIMKQILIAMISQY